MALERGYNLESLANSILGCVEVLLKDKPITESTDDYPFESTLRVIKAVKSYAHESVTLIQMSRLMKDVFLIYDRASLDLMWSAQRLDAIIGKQTDYMQTLVHISRGPNKDRINKSKAQLAREFEMKDLGPANKILGMQIHRDRVSREIWLSQKSYVKKILQRFNMQDCKPISTPFPTDVKLSSKMSHSSEKERMKMSRVPYASAVGSLMFAMICTRPDIAHAVGVVSRYMAEPGRGHWEAVKRILRYIKGTSDVALCFGESDLIVKGYVDSDYAGDLDGSKSTTGYVFTLSGGTVSWVSKLQSVVAMSTTEAENMLQLLKPAKQRSMVEDDVGRARIQTKLLYFVTTRVPCILQGIQHFIQRQSIYEFSITSFVRKWKKEPCISRKFIFIPMITWQIIRLKQSTVTSLYGADPHAA
ncbi:retrovirus-related pol polyprotein from transposon TNT 1-94 [Tanacetum coccineum]